MEIHPAAQAVYLFAGLAMAQGKASALIAAGQVQKLSISRRMIQFLISINKRRNRYFALDAEAAVLSHVRCAEVQAKDKAKDRCQLLCAGDNIE